MSNQKQDLTLHWIIALNAVPVLGVLFFGWHLFELISLYWLENVVIGVFTLLKFVVRRYEYKLELLMPLLFAPFFVVHYGGFTAVHGIFVWVLFGEAWVETNHITSGVAWTLLFETGLVFALLSLVVLHARDYSRDLASRGAGADSVITLMTAPYRRIFVLHLTILGSGFALRGLGEPMLALLLLVGLKTGFDVYHARRGTDVKKISEKKAEFLKAAVLEKKFTINGKEYRFDTYTEMVDSQEYNSTIGLLNILMTREEREFVEGFLAEKLAEEGEHAAA